MWAIILAVLTIAGLAVFALNTFGHGSVRGNLILAMAVVAFLAVVLMFTAI